MHRNSLYSLRRHCINSFEVYNPPPSPKKECSDLKGTISSRYLLSFIVAPWIASLGPSGACGRAVWRLLGGPGDPLGGLWGGLGEVLGRFWGFLKASWTLCRPRRPQEFPGELPRVPRDTNKKPQEGPESRPKDPKRPFLRPPETMKMRLKDTLKIR